jgi:ribosomal protein S6E (S10)
MDGKEYSANFDLEGAWIETEYEIEASDIPAVVKAAIENESAGLKIGEALVSETKDGKVFEITAGKGKNAMAFVVDANGTIQSKSLVKEEEEKEEKEEK